jgi:hypothetical protein
MVEISSSGSGEGPGWATGRGYSTARKRAKTVDKAASSRATVPDRPCPQFCPDASARPSPVLIRLSDEPQMQHSDARGQI